MFSQLSTKMVQSKTYVRHVKIVLFYVLNDFICFYFVNKLLTFHWDKLKNG